jgi:AcrR family transcriptional regulator
MPVLITDQRFRPRKTPRQMRANETRARILDAAKQVFSTHGYAAGTTNRIAVAAGMSVGSLYQYFPNKDAILVELVAEHIEEGTRKVAATLDTVLARHAPDLPPLTELIDAVVEAMIELHTTDRALHRVLFEQAPRPDELLAELKAVEAALVDEAARLLGGHPEVEVPDTKVAARLTVTTVESVVHRSAADASGDMPDDRLRTELVRMVVGYLRGR